MGRIFITGSSDGLGLMAAQQLAKNGHEVTLHARNLQRAADARAACPEAAHVLIGDLSSMQETRELADAANNLLDEDGDGGAFDCIVHNAGLYRSSFARTPDGLPALIAVNVVAPYLLTCLMRRPRRLVFLSSDSHYGGDADLKDLLWRERGEARWSDGAAYADSKLCNNLFANAFARRWPHVASNSFHPGWMATKMGGSAASRDFASSVDTYVLLAEGRGKGVESGRYFEPGRREGKPHGGASSFEAQDKLLAICREATGVDVPA